MILARTDSENGEKLKKQIHMLLSGKVTGVFFRTFTKQEAGKLGITGWARNTKDGRLEIVAQGEQKQLEELMKKCKRGPIMAQVREFDTKEEQIEEEFEYFDVRPT
jgi:acylphosphatase